MAVPAGVLRPAWADIDLDALVANFTVIAGEVAPAGVLAVVKADAYGHGAARVGRALEAAGVPWLGVALVEEGAAVRAAGVRTPILVLGPASADQLPLFRRYRLTPTVTSLEQLVLWRDWSAAAGGRQAFHLKIDTGMTRLGLAPDEVAPALEIVRGAADSLQLAGFLSHLADADQLLSTQNAAQQQRFGVALGQLLPEERAGAIVHFANSAGALHHAATRHDLVRIGMALYGLDPAGRHSGLRPVMSVRARIVRLREVPSGTRLGYGGKRITQRRSRIALVPLGYADGYGHRLSDRAEALVGGRRVPVAGAVSMDMTLVDVTDVAAAVGDEVVLLGRQGDKEVTAGELARVAGTIPWEILCLLGGLRLTRRYWQGGQVVDTRSRFDRGMS